MRLAVEINIAGNITKPHIPHLRGKHSRVTEDVIAI
jgi:hypothetical protein